LLKGNKGEQQPKFTDQIATELDIHDPMITALTEIFEDK